MMTAAPHENAPVSNLSHERLHLTHRKFLCMGGRILFGRIKGEQLSRHEIEGVASGQGAHLGNARLEGHVADEPPVASVTIVLS